MKQIIESVLQRHQDRQVNLSSQAARKTLAEEIALVLADRGDYRETPRVEREARASWICQICKKSTYEVDFDYIGSGTNHLGCELQIEIDNAAGINPNDPEHEIPDLDPQTGQLNPLYEELTDKKNPWRERNVSFTPEI